MMGANSWQLTTLVVVCFLSYSSVLSKPTADRLPHHTHPEGERADDSNEPPFIILSTSREVQPSDNSGNEVEGHKPLFSDVAEEDKAAKKKDTSIKVGAARRRPAPRAIDVQDTSKKMMMGGLMPFSFNFDVQDASQGVYHSRSEVQPTSGPLVGSYSYFRPDGVYMTVKYTAGSDGYKATVYETQPPQAILRAEASKIKLEEQVPPSGAVLRGQGHVRVPIAASGDSAPSKKHSVLKTPSQTIRDAFKHRFPLRSSVSQPLSFVHPSPFQTGNQFNPIPSDTDTDGSLIESLKFSSANIGDIPTGEQIQQELIPIDIEEQHNPTKFKQLGQVDSILQGTTGLEQPGIKIGQPIIIPQNSFGVNAGGTEEFSIKSEFPHEGEQIFISNDDLRPSELGNAGFPAPAGTQIENDERFQILHTDGSHGFVEPEQQVNSEPGVNQEPVQHGINQQNHEVFKSSQFDIDGQRPIGSVFTTDHDRTIFNNPENIDQGAVNQEPIGETIVTGDEGISIRKQNVIVKAPDQTLFSLGEQGGSHKNQNKDGEQQIEDIPINGGQTDVFENNENIGQTNVLSSGNNIGHSGVQQGFTETGNAKVQFGAIGQPVIRPATSLQNQPQKPTFDNFKFSGVHKPFNQFSSAFGSLPLSQQQAILDQYFPQRFSYESGFISPQQGVEQNKFGVPSIPQTQIPLNTHIASFGHPEIPSGVGVIQNERVEFNLPIAPIHDVQTPSYYVVPEEEIISSQISSDVGQTQFSNVPVRNTFIGAVNSDGIRPAEQFYESNKQGIQSSPSASNFPGDSVGVQFEIKNNEEQTPFEELDIAQEITSIPVKDDTISSVPHFNIQGQSNIGIDTPQQIAINAVEDKQLQISDTDLPQNIEFSLPTEKENSVVIGVSNTKFSDSRPSSKHTHSVTDQTAGSQNTDEQEAFAVQTQFGTFNGFDTGVLSGSNQVRPIDITTSFNYLPPFESIDKQTEELGNKPSEPISVAGKIEHKTGNEADSISTSSILPSVVFSNQEFDQDKKSEIEISHISTGGDISSVVTESKLALNQDHVKVPITDSPVINIVPKPQFSIDTTVQDIAEISKQHALPLSEAITYSDNDSFPPQFSTLTVKSPTPTFSELNVEQQNSPVISSHSLKEVKPQTHQEISSQLQEKITSQQQEADIGTQQNIPYQIFGEGDARPFSIFQQHIIDRNRVIQNTHHHFHPNSVSFGSALGYNPITFGASGLTGDAAARITSDGQSVPVNVPIIQYQYPGISTIRAGISQGVPTISVPDQYKSVQGDTGDTKVTKITVPVFYVVGDPNLKNQRIFTLPGTPHEAVNIDNSQTSGTQCSCERTKDEEKIAQKSDLPASPTETIVAKQENSEGKLTITDEIQGQDIQEKLEPNDSFEVVTRVIHEKEGDISNKQQSLIGSTRVGTKIPTSLHKFSAVPQTATFPGVSVVKGQFSNPSNKPSFTVGPLGQLSPAFGTLLSAQKVGQPASNIRYTTGQSFGQQTAPKGGYRYAPPKIPFHF